MLHIAYVTAARVPSERAHAIQIIKTCEALGRRASVTLIAPARKGRLGENPFAYHTKLEHTFSCTYLPVIDTVAHGKAGFWFHQLYFGIQVIRHLRREKFQESDSGVVYGRDEALMWLLAVAGFTVAWESHQGSLNWFARKLIARKTPIVVISEGLFHHYVKNNVAAERLFVAHDGVDINAFQTTETKITARKRLGLSEAAKIALYIGNLDEWKGWRTFASAATMMPEVTSVIIGGSEAQLKAARAEYPNVLFLGARPYDELAQNQSAADVLVIPNTATNALSATFTSPLKMFAHMASGVPIVASNVPSICEILSENEAVLVEPDNPSALAEGIRRAVSEGVLRSQAAYLKVKNYSWEARAGLIHSFLKKWWD